MRKHVFIVSPPLPLSSLPPPSSRKLDMAINRTCQNVGNMISNTKTNMSEGREHITGSSYTPASMLDRMLYKTGFQNK